MTDPAALPPFSAYPPPPAPVPAAESEWSSPTGFGAPVRPSFWARWTPRAEVRSGVVIVVVLVVLGALLGVLWQWWSPPGPLGFVVAPGAIQPDESEAFIAADGRFAIIVGAVGLIAGVVVWRRKRTRGPVAVAALAVGGALGALLTAVVGHLLGGGSASGPANTLLKQLPLTVHIRGLLVLEAVVAVLVYSLFTAFTANDDLGRPDPYGPAPRPPIG